MPTLIWASKSTASPIPASLETVSIIYPHGVGYPDVTAEDTIILGDNLSVMSALLPEYEGKIDLIYADPPFFTNRQYATRVGRGEDSRRPQEWRLAEGYPDHWDNLDAYLDMLYPRLVMMRRLLSSRGTLYLHLDWHANAYARLLLDEIFGAANLLNEIIWAYHGPSPIRRAFNRKHDTILAYTKSGEYTFNVDAVRQPYDPITLKTFASSPKAGFGKVPDLGRGKVPEDWWYFPVIARMHNERTGYPTQKPVALLERIILASSNPGDLVADFFCGSGTVAVVAAGLGRRFIANDLTWRAVHTTRVRLVETASRPFIISRDKSTPYPIKKSPEINFQPSAQSVSLDLSLLEKLDYWEVDPAWDSTVFRSVVQATRPQKKGTIASHLNLPVLPESKSINKIAVRLVDISGGQYQAG